MKLATRIAKLLLPVALCVAAAGPASATVTAQGSDTTGRAGEVRTGRTGESGTTIAA